MYSLMLLLSLLTAAAFLHVFAFRRRGYLPAFIVFLGLLVYTHNWGLFMAAGSIVALVPCWYVSDDRRGIVRDALIGFGVRRAALPAVGAHAAPPDPAHRRALAQLAQLRRADPDLEGRCSAAARRRWRSCWRAARASP